MKHTFILFCIVLLSSGLFAQTKTATQSQPQPDSMIRNRLVELALQNPAMKIAGYEKDKTRYEVTKANSNWLNYVTATVNINDVTTGSARRNNPDLNNIYYPLWNIGINVPLGSFTGKAQDVKIAKRNKDIATENQSGQARLLKRQVLSLYEEYISKRELLKMQSEMTLDDKTAFETLEEKFSTGSISYQEYSTANKLYNEQMAKQRILEKELNVTKLEIEEMIGVPLEDVLLLK
ncbi:TolC family protein [Chitinophaga barathri]|uniref:TolC family protein n=1 Tax=Chitinophaga barathri TaxID=1647451 RepID=A0A3N4MRZ0_9BACT|nr:TolC family protein [Chitinophaga barathri]RPD38143.1 hypothetical protein EG028_26130 [Chitinophaga barathri]